MSEQDYIDGRRAALSSLFHHFARELDGPEGDHASALAQLSATRAALRSLSRELNCNNWPDNLHLADVVEKYIGRSEAVSEWIDANSKTDSPEDGG